MQVIDRQVNDTGICVVKDCGQEDKDYRDGEAPDEDGAVAICDGGKTAAAYGRGQPADRPASRILENIKRKKERAEKDICPTAEAQDKVEQESRHGECREEYRRQAADDE